MKLSEIFYSIQGEGPNLGEPAVFLRMALCNLSCKWCDTKYTWDWENYDQEKEVKDMELDKVKKEILKYSCKHLVLTGGEPMLQQDELILLLRFLKERVFYVEVESNGTIIPKPEIEQLVDQWNISPKLTSSKNPIDLREKQESYEYYRNLPNSFFKYVVQDEYDLDEVQRLIKKYDIPINRILLMPEGFEKEELAKRSKWLVKFCEENGYHFTPRIQIILWGNKRGF
ncbi:MAG: 7-carboxy-7-deazaguanine synthase QueE [Candidatus Methylarchaceae archaeon HK01M]|nr:7-carboxy-7-deazaguanine synthase QueE [Candidatus Methylarchaceae archaeon HK01M]